jgi:hypothetical protein
MLYVRRICGVMSTFNVQYNWVLYNHACQQCVSEHVLVDRRRQLVNKLDEVAARTVFCARPQVAASPHSV